MGRPTPIRDPHGTLLGYQCPECNFKLYGSGGEQWHSKLMADISTHIAETHRRTPPPSHRVTAHR